MAVKKYTKKKKKAGQKPIVLNLKGVKASPGAPDVTDLLRTMNMCPEGDFVATLQITWSPFSKKGKKKKGR